MWEYKATNTESISINIISIDTLTSCMDCFVVGYNTASQADDTTLINIYSAAKDMVGLRTSDCSPSPDQ
jgi:hypothetical protein